MLHLKNKRKTLRNNSIWLRWWTVIDKLNVTTTAVPDYTELKKRQIRQLFKHQNIFNCWILGLGLWTLGISNLMLDWRMGIHAIDRNIVLRCHCVRHLAVSQWHTAVSFAMVALHRRVLKLTTAFELSYDRDTL